MNKIRKIISIAVIFFFIINNIYTRSNFAYNGRPTLFNEKSNAQRYLSNKQEQEGISQIPSSISIPQELGRVLEFYKGEDEESVVVHIQDRHADPIAQFNISRIIDLLHKKYNIKLLCLEGASTEVDTSFYDQFADGKIKDDVTKFFVKKAFFTGSEYYKIMNSKADLSAIGVEDSELYLKHMASYNFNSAKKDRIIAFSRSLEGSLELLKQKVYSNDLRKLDSIALAYSNKNIQLPEYLKTFSEYAQKTGIDILKYPNIAQFLELARREREIDFKKAEDARKQLIDRLTKELKDAKLRELIHTSINFRAGNITDEEFYDYLSQFFNDSKTYNLELTTYNSLVAYIAYLKFSKTINHIKVFEEADYLEQAVLLGLAKSQLEKDLVQYSYSVKLLNDLYALKLTPQKLCYFGLTANFRHPDTERSEREGSKYSDINNIKKFLITNYEKYGFVIPEIIRRTELSQNVIDSATYYYQLALERDIALVSNTIKNMQNYKKPKSILVTGGFHTQGITNILKDKGISYVVICPNVGFDDCDKAYEARLEGKLPTSSQLAEFFIQTLCPPILTAGASNAIESAFKALIYSADYRNRLELEKKPLFDSISQQIVDAVCLQLNQNARITFDEVQKICEEHILAAQESKKFDEKEKTSIKASSSGSSLKTKLFITPLIIGSLAMFMGDGPLPKANSFQYPVIIEQTLQQSKNDVKMLKKQLSSYNQQDEWDEVTSLSEIMNNESCVKVLKDYMIFSTNRYKLLVVLDVLNLIYNVDYYTGNYNYYGEIDPSFYLIKAVNSGAEQWEFAEYLFIEYLRSDFIRDVDKIGVLGGCSPVSISKYSVNLFSALKDLIVTSNASDIRYWAVESLLKFAKRDKQAVEVLKELLLNPNVDNTTIMQIASPFHWENIEGGLKIGCLNLNALSYYKSLSSKGNANRYKKEKDYPNTLLLMIKIIRKIREESFKNPRINQLYNYIQQSKHDLLIITDLEDFYNDLVKFDKRFDGHYMHFRKLRDINKFIIKNFGWKEVEEDSSILILKLVNLLKVSNDKIGEIPEDIIIDYIVGMFVHEFDHYYTDKINLDKDVYNSQLLIFTNEKHAYLIQADINKHIVEKYKKGLLNIAYWSKIWHLQRDIGILDTNSHMIESQYMKGFTKLEAGIIKKYELDAKIIRAQIRESDSGAGLYSAEDLKFGNSQWIPEFRQHPKSSSAGDVGVYEYVSQFIGFIEQGTINELSIDTLQYIYNNKKLAKDIMDGLSVPDEMRKDFVNISHKVYIGYSELLKAGNYSSTIGQIKDDKIRAETFRKEEFRLCKDTLASLLIADLAASQNEGMALKMILDIKPSSAGVTLGDIDIGGTVSGEIKASSTGEEIIDTQQTISTDSIDLWPPWRVIVDIAQNHVDETRIKKAELWASGKKNEALDLQTDLIFILRDGKRVSFYDNKDIKYDDVQSIVFTDSGSGYNKDLFKYKWSVGKNQDNMKKEVLNAFSEMGIDLPGGKFGEGQKMAAASLLNTIKEQERESLPKEKRMGVVYRSENWQAKLFANPVQIIMREKSIDGYTVALKVLDNSEHLNGSKTIIENPTKELFDICKNIDDYVIDFNPPKEFAAKSEEGTAFKVPNGKESLIFVRGYRVVKTSDFFQEKNFLARPLFSYNLSNAKLSRDRNQLESDNTFGAIADILVVGATEQTKIDLLNFAFKYPSLYCMGADGNSQFNDSWGIEFEALANMKYNKKGFLLKNQGITTPWVVAFYNKFGKDVLLASSSDLENDSSKQALAANKHLIVLNAALFKMLESIGVKTDFVYTRKILNEYKLGLSLNYEKDRWGELRIVLDFLQNHVDAVRKYNYTYSPHLKAMIEFQLKKSTEWLPISNIYNFNNDDIVAVRFSDKSTDGYGHSYLHQIGSQKKESPQKQIGEFGEGLKIASAASLRLGFNVKLSSQDWTADAFSYAAFMKKNKQDDYVGDRDLGFRVYEVEDRGISETIISCFEHKGRENFNSLLNIVRDLRRYVRCQKDVGLADEDPIPIYSTKSGDIILSEDKKIFVKEFFITNEEAERLIFCYNFNELNVNRDRNIVSNEELENEIRSILSNLNDVVLIKQILLYANKYPTGKYHEFQNLTQLPAFEQNKILWAEALRVLTNNNDVVLRSNMPAAPKEAEFIGYEVVFLNEEIAKNLRSAGILFDYEVINPKFEFINPKQLTIQELRVLDVIREIDRQSLIFSNNSVTEYKIFECAKNSIDQKPMPAVKGYSGPKGEFIAFKRECLSDPVKVLEIYIEETAHRLSGAPDASREHFNSVMEALRQLIENAKNAQKVNYIFTKVFPGFNIKNLSVDVDEEVRDIELALNETTQTEVNEGRLLKIIKAKKTEWTKASSTGDVQAMRDELERLIQKLNGNDVMIHPRDAYPIIIDIDTIRPDAVLLLEKMAAMRNSADRPIFQLFINGADAKIGASSTVNKLIQSNENVVILAKYMENNGLNLSEILNSGYGPALKAVSNLFSGKIGSKQPVGYIAGPSVLKQELERAAEYLADNNVNNIYISWESPVEGKQSAFEALLANILTRIPYHNPDSVLTAQQIVSFLKPIAPDAYKELMETLIRTLEVVSENA